MIPNLNDIYTFFTSYNFWLLCEVSSLVFKCYLLFALIKLSKKTTTNKKLYFIFIILLISSMMYSNIPAVPFNLYWIYHILDFRLVTFTARLGWLFSILQTLSITLLLQNLANPTFKINKYNFIGMITGGILALFQLYFIVFEFNNTALIGFKLDLEIQLTQLDSIYMLAMLIPVFINNFRQIKRNQLPKILMRQLNILTYGFIIPYIIVDLISGESFLLPFVYYFKINKNLMQGLSSLIISSALYYFTKKIIGLRFLNLQDHVATKETLNFTKDFTHVLEQLSCVTMPHELAHVVRFFFEQTLQIPKTKVALYLDLKQSNTHDANASFLSSYNTLSSKIETYLAHENNVINRSINQYKIFIKDEIEFTNFYQNSDERTEIIDFLNDIHADVFLPIYEGKALTSCIVVEKNARAKKLYNNTERDEMLIFSSYLSNVINILKKGDVEAKLKKEKELEDELYKKHQEINQYKESLKVLLKNNEEKQIGILFYRNNKFNFANQSAQDLINIDLNKNITHPLKKEITEVALQALKYKSTHKITTSETHTISLYAITGTEANTVIILAQKLVISEMIKSYFDLLKNPSVWDYLIYLDTTKSGRLINRLIPGSSQTLIDLKIELLSIALSKKATLLQCPEDDAVSIVEIIHEISLREKLQIITLTSEEKNNEFAIKLFGFNSILGQNNQKDSLLENLDKVGTLFIQNVELLNIETQHLLAEFISYGYFKKIKSLTKIFSDVRIICSTKKDLQKLTNDGLFSPTLFEQLKKSKLYLPSLTQLSELDLLNLIEHYTSDTSQKEAIDLSLENKDMLKILTDKPNSLHKLKERINAISASKITKQSYEKLSILEDINDPQLAEAINAGKRALKDKKLLEILWNKYKNQSKIASLLNVHRSSVNRRCEEYGIG